MDEVKDFILEYLISSEIYVKNYLKNQISWLVAWYEGSDEHVICSVQKPFFPERSDLSSRADKSHHIWQVDFFRRILTDIVQFTTVRKKKCSLNIVTTTFDFFLEMSNNLWRIFSQKRFKMRRLIKKLRIALSICCFQ